MAATTDLPECQVEPPPELNQSLRSAGSGQQVHDELLSELMQGKKK
jgi:hypothetical protein